MQEFEIKFLEVNVPELEKKLFAKSFFYANMSVLLFWRKPSLRQAGIFNPILL
ncbi:MAG: hypothetical protein UU71_C0031G0016 [Parcubacteria group bacterium GW2011_GWB1_41_6]|nr:MAG: hypothetical protein UU01_C0010G0016 [Parcubacteria group bacterium GW2011_GWA2_40_37]KKS14231.1 MAG: hypothetical protein UU71_C0031G0016 [Parcubacteria group bacterium GW2011_GWB1_41_6]KKS72417.1 MAG: hypothetical protein UV43_C0017G0017 [Parcubacteria group bacterium GW2011_GWF2_42_7]